MLSPRKMIRGLDLNQRPLGKKPSTLPLSYPGSIDYWFLLGHQSPGAGLEPAPTRSVAECSATELPRNSSLLPDSRLLPITIQNVLPKNKPPNQGWQSILLAGANDRSPARHPPAAQQEAQTPFSLARPASMARAATISFSPASSVNHRECRLSLLRRRGYAGVAALNLPCSFRTRQIGKRWQTCHPRGLAWPAWKRRKKLKAAINRRTPKTRLRRRGRAELALLVQDLQGLGAVQTAVRGDRHTPRPVDRRQGSGMLRHRCG